jgi:hypothetical protein
VLKIYGGGGCSRKGNLIDERVKLDLSNLLVGAKYLRNFTRRGRNNIQTPLCPKAQQTLSFNFFKTVIVGPSSHFASLNY